MNESNEILITGGTGLLGNRLSKLLYRKEIPHLISSRRNKKNLANWQYMDLINGAGMSEAVKNKRIVFHLASATGKHDIRNDVEGTQKLLKASSNAGVMHFIYISIVGIDKIPLTYYRYKLQAEQIIIQSGIPYSILRTTQFHDFVDYLFHRYIKYRVNFFPLHIKVQPVEPDAVADQLFVISQNEPISGVIEAGGPEVYSSGELVKSWLQIQEKSKLILNFPLSGKLKKSLYSGALTTQQLLHSGKTWQKWLADKYNKKTNFNF